MGNGRKRLRSDERKAIMHLDMLGRSFGTAIGMMESRLEGVPYVKRDIGMLKYICMRLVSAALEDESADTVAQILRQSRDFELHLERVSPVRRYEECVMPLEDEWQFVHICLESRCGICMKTDAEARNCEIGRLLRRYVDEPDPGLMGCGFMGCDLSDGDGLRMNKQKRL